MPRQASIAVENSFIKGLITEATALNFPENACTDTLNCVFNFNGSVERRLGFAQEYIPPGGDTVVTDIDRGDVAMSTYLWKNVSGNGNINIVVVQAGENIFFFKASNASVGSGLLSLAVVLTDHSDATTEEVQILEAQYSNSSKYLVITHPLCDPIRVSFDESDDTVADTGMTLQIRDFEGDVADTLAIRERPTGTAASLTVAHQYNLYNQGWRDTEITAWDTGRTDLPSNADVWWSYKVPTVVSSTTFDRFSTSAINDLEPGNSPAPKGHFHFPIWDRNRDTATSNAHATSEDIAALSGVTNTNSGNQRPSTSAFYAGRIFYSGLNYTGLNSDIYFTQIIERDDQYEKCFQDNDPTAEELHDLLPSDGGVIKIPEAGTIIKLFSIAGFLIAFATNGIWAITGSTGLGFVANDYVVQKISTINALTGASFVDVGGYPAWWNLDGIYILTAPPAGGSMPQVKSLTHGIIQRYYDDIPAESKSYARGYYNTNEWIIQWIFNKEVTEGNLEDKYNFRDILNYNTITGAWYPWSAEDDNMTINGITVMNGNQGFVTTNQVVDGSANNVVDGSSNNVITFGFSETAPADLVFKYLTTTFNSDDDVWETTFSETRNFGLTDWDQEDSYESFFITGYKTRGQAIIKAQPTWLQIYMDIPDTNAAANLTYPPEFIFRAGFDYPDFDDPDSFLGQEQNALFFDRDFYRGDVRIRKVKQSKRFKVRGHGKTVQFKVRNRGTRPFRIEGWTTFDTKNALP